MTDRELLELAAKAAGYWSTEFNCPDRLPRPGWDPLTDDGDALRLAVRLGFCVDIETPCGAVTAGRACETFDCDDHEAAMAATRRAIVRAAAAIGRAKE